VPYHFVQIWLQQCARQPVIIFNINARCFCVRMQMAASGVCALALPLCMRAAPGWQEFVRRAQSSSLLPRDPRPAAGPA